MTNTNGNGIGSQMDGMEGIHFGHIVYWNGFGKNCMGKLGDFGETYAPSVGNGSEMARYKRESIPTSANKAADNALFYHSPAVQLGIMIICHLFFNIMYIIGHLGQFLRFDGAIFYRGGWGQKGRCHTGNSINPHTPLHVSAHERVVLL